MSWRKSLTMSKNDVQEGPLSRVLGWPRVFGPPGRSEVLRAPEGIDGRATIAVSRIDAQRPPGGSVPRRIAITIPYIGKRG